MKRKATISVTRKPARLTLSAQAGILAAAESSGAHVSMHDCCHHGQCPAARAVNVSLSSSWSRTNRDDTRVRDVGQALICAGRHSLVEQCQVEEAEGVDCDCDSCSTCSTVSVVQAPAVWGCWQLVVWQRTSVRTVHAALKHRQQDRCAPCQSCSARECASASTMDSPCKHEPVSMRAMSTSQLRAER